MLDICINFAPEKVQVQLINATLGGRGKSQNKTQTREGNLPPCLSLKNDYLCP